MHRHTLEVRWDKRLHGWLRWAELSWVLQPRGPTKPLKKQCFRSVWKINAYCLCVSSAFVLLFLAVTPSCASTEFKCVTSGECIPVAFVCDGDEDCADGSDEERSCGKCFTANLWFQIQSLRGSCNKTHIFSRSRWTNLQPRPVHLPGWPVCPPTIQVWPCKGLCRQFWWKQLR